MATLQEVRDALLDADDPAGALRQADHLLDAYAKQREKYVLPREQVFFQAILDYYVDDLAGWVKFVTNVRDRLPERGDARRDVQALLRTLDVRLTQQVRRERISRAVAMAIRKAMVKDVYDDKIRYGRRCVQSWKLRRETLLKSLRDRTATGRVSVEEREEALAEFWQGIDEEIDRGELPKP